MATSFEGSKTDPLSASMRHLLKKKIVKTSPVDSEIIGLKGIIKKKKN